MKEAKK